MDGERRGTHPPYSAAYRHRGSAANQAARLSTKPHGGEHCTSRSGEVVGCRHCGTISQPVELTGGVGGQKALDANNLEEKQIPALRGLQEAQRCRQDRQLSIACDPRRLDSLGDASFFSIIDLRSAFLQVPLRPEDRKKTDLRYGVDYTNSRCCLLG